MFQTEAELEDFLAAPTAEDQAAMNSLEGDLLILGVAGKMGPSLAQRARRAVAAAGVRKRIIGVSRFSDEAVRGQLEANGIETISADLLDQDRIDQLPDAANVIFMAGRKFGSIGAERLTWATNACVPVWVARRYRDSKIVAFSSGNVYPFVPVKSEGATEETQPLPLGEYAQSVLARERIFEFFSERYGTRMCMLRLNYAVEVRYGVLLDIGTRVFEGRPVSLSMGYLNAIWQGDANSVCLRSFGLCESPLKVLNLTGPETLAVRDVATRFGDLFHRKPVFEGREAETALLSNASQCHRLFGPPKTDVRTAIEWTAHWIQAGGPTWAKPTHFEARDGRF